MTRIERLRAVAIGATINGTIRRSHRELRA